MLIDKRTMSAKPVGLRDAFARKHFSSMLGPNGEWSDALEDTWRTLENANLPHLKRLQNGARDADGRSAVKVIAAIHYVRSDAFELTQGRLSQQVVDHCIEGLPENRRLFDALARDLGRNPTLAELTEQAGETAERWRSEGRRLFVQEMRHSYKRVRKILKPLHVQLAWQRDPAPDFVFGDQVFVHSHHDGRVSMLEDLALGDATQAFIPLGPRLVALFSSERLQDTVIPLSTVVDLNQKVWRAAVRFVGASFATRLDRALKRHDIQMHR